MADYTYTALDYATLQFRLLELQPLPNKPEGTIECRLSYASLNDKPKPLPYETISYVWGSAERSSVILVDGKVLMVPESSERVLRRVVRPEGTRTVWIDAICINQEDRVERAIQVLCMRFIFAFSSGNVIYLGEDDGFVARAARNVEEIAREIEEETDEFRRMKEVILPDAIFANAKEPMRAEVDVEALRRLYGRAWFSRAWVVQEAKLAPKNTCLCGDLEMNFTSILRVSAWLYHYHAFHIPRPLYQTPGLANASDQWESSISKNFWFTPATALTRTILLEATDPRDKIFGMLGIMEGRKSLAVPELLRPDYSKSVAYVFRDATRYAIQYHRNLYLLRYISHRSEEDLRSEFPTWTPRWERARVSAVDPGMLSLGYRRYSGIWSSNDTAFGTMRDRQSDNDTLVLRGLKLDVIAGIFPIFLQESCRRFWAFMFFLSHRSAHAKRRLAKCLTAEMNYLHQKASEEDLDLFDDWLAFMRSGPGKKLSNVTSITPHMDQAVKRATYFHQAQMNACNNRRFAVTRGGLMALVPKVARKKDVFALMDAGDAPFVLRQVGDTYLMLGEGYLENNMSEEALRRQEDAGRPDDVFHVR